MSACGTRTCATDNAPLSKQRLTKNMSSVTEKLTRWPVADMKAQYDEGGDVSLCGGRQSSRFGIAGQVIDGDDTRSVAGDCSGQRSMQVNTRTVKLFLWAREWLKLY